MSARSLFHLARDNSGAAILEFALVAPILMVMVMGLADFGLAANEKMRLTSAVRAGLQAGYSNSTDAIAITKAVQKASGLQAGSISVASATTCGCADGSAVGCDGTCAGGKVQTYITVTVSEAYSLMLNYPGLSGPVSLNASATVRVN